jgi:hypothetical protein
VLAQQDELQTQLQQVNAQGREIESLRLQLQQQNISLQERLQNLESYVLTQMKNASSASRAAIAGSNGGVQ